MNFIKELFDKKKSNETHIQFQKFSKGEFRNRALIELKKSGKGYSLKTSAEFVNGLVYLIASKIGSNKTKVTGAIVSTSDLKEKIKFKEVKQFQGVKRYLLEQEMSGNEIKDLIEKFPKAFFALSFSFGEDTLKIKPKAPKSGKPGKGDEAPKADFCSLKTNDEFIAKSFVFEKENFSKAIINHTFIVEKIVIPDSLKDSKDFAKIREESLRKGKIIRNAKIDDLDVNSEFEFEA